MPGQAAHRTNRRIEYERCFQVLSRKVVLRADCARIGFHLDYLVQRATSDWPSLRSLEIDVRTGTKEEGYRVHYDGQMQFAHREPSAIVYLIFADLYRAASEGLEDQVQLHAASLVFRDRRVLAVGQSGVGKTTIAMAALVRDGWRVEGDNQVFLKNSVVMACPRRFHIKEEGLDMVPNAIPDVTALPQLIGDGRPIYALDPSGAGFDWQISQGPVDALVHLERPTPPSVANASIETCSKINMVQLLTFHANPALGDRKHCFQQLSMLADSAACFRLSLGSPIQSLVAIESTLQ